MEFSFPSHMGLFVFLFVILGSSIFLVFLFNKKKPTVGTLSLMIFPISIGVLIYAVIVEVMK
jgi:hypothetical protein